MRMALSVDTFRFRKDNEFDFLNILVSSKLSLDAMTLREFLFNRCKCTLALNSHLIPRPLKVDKSTLSYLQYQFQMNESIDNYPFITVESISNHNHRVLLELRSGYSLAPLIYMYVERYIDLQASSFAVCTRKNQRMPHVHLINWAQEQQCNIFFLMTTDSNQFHFKLLQTSFSSDRIRCMAYGGSCTVSSSSLSSDSTGEEPKIKHFCYVDNMV